MAGTFYPIKGVPDDPFTPGTKFRQEINRWMEDRKNKKQVDLFMLALRDMQKTDYQELLSYYRIAGIHSYPLQEWDGVPYERRPPPNSKPGFCAHNLAIFPTWHRPYMLLFEQHIHTLMMKNIKSWNLEGADANPWLHAAYTFRLPYWDWAQRQPYIDDFGIPQICTQDTVTVDLPGNKTETFENPLAKFTNPKGVAMGDPSMGKYAVKNNPDKGDLPWSQCIGTSRYGIYKDQPVSTWNKGVNDWAKVNAVVKKPGWYGKGGNSTFADAVERMLSPNYHDSYESFACTQFNNPQDKKNTSYMSLEYIHNVAHVAAGGFFANSTGNDPDDGPTGLGHMSDVPVSAFDPLFFLHHCNIDRLLAIWQTFNDDKWFSPSTTPGPGDDLLPFHISAEGDFWNSNLTQTWTAYNYQYDDLARLPEDFINGQFDKDKYLARLRTYFNVLYKGSSNAVRDAPTFESASKKFPDYIVNIIYDRYALDGRPYSIMLFLGEPPADNELYQYSQHPNYLGQVYTFSSSIELEGEVACGNCQTQKGEHVLSAAQVPVTIQLMQKASQQEQWRSEGQEGLTPLPIPQPLVGPLDPELVRELFAQQLRVVYVELGGEVHNADEFPQTEIALLHAPASFTVHSSTEAEGGSIESVVPTYDGQYKVLFKRMEGQPATAGPLFTTEANNIGRIRDDPDRT